MTIDERLKSLITQRNSAWESARHYWESEEETLEATDAEAAARANAEITAFDERIEELHKLNKANKNADDYRAQYESIVRPDVRDAAEKNEKESLLDFLRGGTGNVSAQEFEVRFDHPAVDVDPKSGAWHLRALGEDTSGAGGATVPTDFVSTLYQHLIANSAIRQTNVQVVTTSNGQALPFPKTTNHGTAVAVGEGTAIAGTDPSFGQVTLNAWKYGQVIHLSNELIVDTAVDLTGYLAQAMGRVIGNLSGTDFITGTGVLKPNGVVVATKASVGTSVQIASATIEFANLISLQYAVIEPYATNGWWMMSRATAGVVRALKDGGGHYIMQSSGQLGDPDLLLGRPVVTDPNMAAVASAAMSVIFGDFNSYVIRDVGGFNLARTDALKFAEDQVSYRGTLRTDGDLLDTSGAIKGLDTD